MTEQSWENTIEGVQDRYDRGLTNKSYYEKRMEELKDKPPGPTVKTREELDAMGEKLIHMSQYEPGTDKTKKFSEEFEREAKKRDALDAAAAAELVEQKKQSRKTRSVNPLFKEFNSGELGTMYEQLAKNFSQNKSELKLIAKELEDRDKPSIFEGINLE